MKGIAHLQSSHAFIKSSTIMDLQTAGRNGLPYRYSHLFPHTILEVIHTEIK